MELALSLTREALSKTGVVVRFHPLITHREMVRHAQDLSERRRKSVTFSIKFAFTRPIFSA
jgi:hypothetical protein